MIAWFVIALATLTVFAFVAVNAASNLTTSYDLASRAETARRVDAAINALLTSSDSPNLTGQVWLPAGQTSGGSYILPASLSQYAYTATGQAIVYCPFGGNEAGSNVTVPNYDGTSYTIQTATINGIAYVVNGRPNYAQVSTNPNLLGFLIAPRSRSDNPPSCDSVTYNSTTNLFAVPGGIVRPIMRTLGNEPNRDLATKGVTWYVSTTGTGTGTASSDPAAFTTALDFWRTRQPAAMTIIFANGSYSMPGSYMDVTAGSFSDMGHNASLDLVGSAGSVVVTQSGGGNIVIPQGALNVNGISFDSATNIVANANSTISLTSTAAGSVTANAGGVVTLNSSALSSTSVTPVTANNKGRVVFTGTDYISGGASGGLVTASYNGQISLSNATVYMGTNSGSVSNAFNITQASNLLVTNSTVIVQNPLTAAILLNASAMNASSMTFNIATSGVADFIQAYNGATVNLNGGGLTGTVPTNLGFNDYGAAYVGGSSFTLRGTKACWGYNNATPSTAGVFSQSATPAVGISTSVLADATVTPLPSNTPSLVMAYTVALATNAARDNMRSSNQSAWTCSN